ncbi:MAG: ATP-binding protein [Lachnospiraceae bacterium]|nr:ATP-binding protein [Lachnospiraceae bacterium]
MISRSIEKDITEWINKGKNALLISGARQVGKTYTIRECLKRSGKDHLEVNLIDNPGYTDIFRTASNISDIAMELGFATGHRFIPGETILFIDEIQEYGDIITRIKFWVDDGSYRFILSGSLLGIELTDLRSAPVGYMDEIQMYPMDFIEFLTATGTEPEVIEHLRSHYYNKEPLSETLHTAMMERFVRYLVTGGMPAAVNSFVNDGDLNEVFSIQKNIISLYKRDFTKYEAKEKKLMLQSIYDLIPTQLLKQNRRFNLADIKKGMKYERLEDSFLWLKAAGVAICVFNSTEPRLSLKQNEKSSLVKLYLSDVGLLTCMYGKSTKLGLLTGTGINMGGIYENAVVMELKRHGYDLYYYNSRKLGELDIVIEHKGHILPIEVKSGKDYYVHSAVNNVLSVDEFSIGEAVVFSNYNIRTEGKVTYYPVYMSTFLYDDTVLPIIKTHALKT